MTLEKKVGGGNRRLAPRFHKPSLSPSRGETTTLMDRCEVGDSEGGTGRREGWDPTAAMRPDSRSFSKPGQGEGEMKAYTATRWPRKRHFLARSPFPYHSHLRQWKIKPPYAPLPTGQKDNSQMLLPTTTVTPIRQTNRVRSWSRPPSPPPPPPPAGMPTATVAAVKGVMA